MTILTCMLTARVYKMARLLFISTFRRKKNHNTRGKAACVEALEVITPRSKLSAPASALPVQVKAHSQWPRGFFPCLPMAITLSWGLEQASDPRCWTLWRRGAGEDASGGDGPLEGTFAILEKASGAYYFT